LAKIVSPVSERASFWLEISFVDVHASRRDIIFGNEAGVGVGKRVTGTCEAAEPSGGGQAQVDSRAAYFFLLGGGEPVNAAMRDVKHGTVERAAPTN